MGQVSGKVLLKETSVGIPDLLVEIYDVDPYAPADASTATGAGSAGTRLGSVLTETGGRFTLDYTNPPTNGELDGRRPHLLLLVRAPDEMGGSSDTGILHRSTDVRQDAGPNEAYIIRIPLQTLTAAGLSAPTEVVFDDDEPDAVIQKVNLTISRQATIKQEMQKIAAERITAERQRSAHIETQVQKRLLEKLTGVPDALAERLNFVRPGDDVEAAMFRT